MIGFGVVELERARGRRTASVALLLVLPLFPLAAQIIRGTVRDLESGAPVPGAIMTLLDATDGRELRSSLSDERGHYAFNAGDAGLYRVDVKRIGVKHTTSAAVSIGGGEIREVDLVVAALPVVATTVRVEEPERCGPGASGGEQMVNLWEDARAALTATRLSSAQPNVTVTMERYIRTYDPATMQVKSDNRKRSTTSVENQVQAKSPEFLSRGGYVKTDGDTTTYDAPDANVLLSDTFSREHCFRVVDGGVSRPTLTGLAFEPVEGRRLPDVRGTLWLGRRSRELEWLEFRYTGIPEAPWTDETGGRVEFRRLPTGAWIVQRWWIRMPVLEVTSAPRFRGALFNDSHSKLIELREEGGEVLATSLETATATRRLVSGTVVDLSTGQPLPGAVVEISGTPLRDTSDVAGAFRIEGAPPGSYNVSFTHPRLDSLGTFARFVPIVVGDSDVTSVTLTLPTLKAVALAICPDALRDTTPSMVRGTVRDPDGAPLKGVSVQLDWTAFQTVATELVRRPVSLIALSDARGSYVFCGVPRDLPLTLFAGMPRGARSSPMTVRLPESGFAMFDLVVPAKQRAP